MKEEDAILESASFRFSQEVNCIDGGDIEQIVIRMESNLGVDRDGGCFYVIQTEQWAIEGPEDFKKIFDRINKVLLGTQKTNKDERRNV